MFAPEPGGASAYRSPVARAAQSSESGAGPWHESVAALTLGDIKVEIEEMRVTVAGKDVVLPLQEFDVLVFLMRQAGQPVSHDYLAQTLWQEATPERKRHVSVLIAHLRSKLAGSLTHQLQTIRKRGYGLFPVVTNRIEDIKRVKDGLDVWSEIQRYARSGAPIDPDDLERMKWYGLFHRRQTPGFFMLRLRVPNGIISARQIGAIGRLSNTYGRGQIDITTRQNIQLRWLQIRDVPAIFEELSAVGLDYRQSGMDNIRNVTGCPMAGLDPDELIDASPIARGIQERIVGNKAFSNLPRKFNVSVSGCRHDCATAQIQDLALTPATREGSRGFNVSIGGVMGGGRPTFATPINVFVTPEKAVDLCAAVAMLFRDEGKRDDRQSARLRDLIDDWGPERFRDALSQRLGPLETAGQAELESFSGDHIGVAPQKKAGAFAVGCAIPVGRIKGDDLIEFGRLAENYGSGELRLTNRQNLIIIDVDAADLPALLAEPLLETYSPSPDSWIRRTVSCTGKDFCHLALIDTKGAALDFAKEMEQLMPMSQAPRVHWSGCQHACGQHHVADIGFQAVRVRLGNEIIDAADVFIGGRLGLEPSLATRALRSVPLRDLPQRVARLLESRQAKEGANPRS